MDGLIGVMAVAVVVVFGYAFLQPNHQGEWQQNCASNVRQLALATMQYLQDYQTRYPAVALEVAHRSRHAHHAKTRLTKTGKLRPDAAGGLQAASRIAGAAKGHPVKVEISADDVSATPIYEPGGATYGWADALLIYVHDQKVYHCPANPRRGQNNPTLPGYTDYWYNRNLSDLTLEVVTRPANILMLGEGNDGTDLTDARYCLAALPPEWPINIHNPPFRHNGGATYAFADGHIKWLTPAKITAENGGDATFSLN